MYYKVRTELLIESPEGPVSAVVIHSGPDLSDCLRRAALRAHLSIQANQVHPRGVHFIPHKITQHIAVWMSWSDFAACEKAPLLNSQQTSEQGSSDPGSGT